MVVFIHKTQKKKHGMLQKTTLVTIINVLFWSGTNVQQKKNLDTFCWPKRSLLSNSKIMRKGYRALQTPQRQVVEKFGDSGMACGSACGTEGLGVYQ